MSRPITCLSNLQIKSDSRNNYKGLIHDNITTVQRDAIPTPTNGLEIYNTDTNTFQVYQNSAWTNITTGAATSLNAPVLATVNAPAPVSGAIYYDSTTHQLTIGIGAAYASVYTSPLTQTGNLVMQTLATDPAGGSSVIGEVYYNTTLNVIRVRINGAWNTLNSSVQTATGVGLATGTAFTLPSGPVANVEVLGNQVVGFMYNDTTNNRIRVRANGVWNTVTIVAEP